MTNAELITKNFYKIKKIKSKDIDNIGIIIPKLLKDGVSNNSITLIGIDGKQYYYNINEIDISTTRITNTELKNILDEAIKVSKELIKCKKGIFEKKRNYTQKRLDVAEENFKSILKNIASIYKVIYKDKIEKDKKKKEKEKKIEQEKIKNEKQQLKKIKTTSTPKYKNGGFVILNAIEENASEYDSDCEYTATVYLKTDAAFNKLKKIYRFANKYITREYDAKYKVKIRVNSIDYFDILNIFGNNFLNRTLDVHYHNHYADTEWWTTISVPSFEYTTSSDKYSVSEYSRMGSVADGDFFKDFLDSLRENRILS